MRIRAIAETLRSELADLPATNRRERLTAFLKTLYARRKQKLLPRILAALAQLEAEAGAPPLAVTVAEPFPDMPEGAEVTVSPSMLGGAMVRAGDQMVDTTLSTQLNRLSQTLKS